MKAIEDELNAETKKQSELTAEWQKEIKELNTYKAAKQKLDQKKFELDQAFNNGDYKTASELQYKTIPELQKQIEDFQQQNKENRMISDTVYESDIANVVSKTTNIPVAKLMQGEREKILHLAETLKKRVIGQDNAVELVSNAILRQRAGIKDENKPIGSFLFLGPTGVGKTELAKTLAEALFDSESHIVRLDMSEFMEPHSVAKINWCSSRLCRL